MKKVFCILFLLSTCLFGKIKSPKDIAPFQYNDLIIEVVNWGILSGYDQNGGIIEISKNGVIIKQVLVYKIAYDDNKERDIQDVFITSIHLDGDKLIIENDMGYIYSLDLNTFEVIHILDRKV